MRNIIIVIFVIWYASVSGQTLIDSYSETNADTYASIRVGAASKVAQSFTCSGNYTLNYVKFYIKKTGSPTGNIFCSIYTHSGTYGVSSKPTGTALATSDAVSISSLSTSAALITFTFSGLQQINLSASYYEVSIEYDGGDSSNKLDFALDNTSPTHSGNRAFYTGGTWTDQNVIDAIFYIYGTSGGGGSVNTFNSFYCSEF